MDVPCRLMVVSDEAEGENVCERLRTGGVKCAVEPLPDANFSAGIWGFKAPTALFVLVNERDVEKARVVLKGR